MCRLTADTKEQEVRLRLVETQSTKYVDYTMMDKYE